MFCPACGAPNDKPNQRYCQECGSTLPVAAPDAPGTDSRGPARSIAHRPSGAVSPIEPRSSRHGGLLALSPALRNKLLLGAGGAVLAVLALYIIIGAIVHLVEVLILPVVIIAALVFAGYIYLKRRH